MWGTLSDKISAGPRQGILRSEPRGTYDHILLSQIQDSSNLKGQISVFISPRNRAAQLYPQALGYLFIPLYHRYFKFKILYFDINSTLS
jgi:hypothetical protein